MRQGATQAADAGGRIRFNGSARLAAIAEPGRPRLISAEQSNASIAYGDTLILKLYRRLQAGVQPDIEVARFLTEETGFTASPALLGTIDWVADDGTVTTLAAASEFVRNQGDAWSYVTGALERDLEARAIGLADPDAAGGPVLTGPLDLGATLGRRTAELHLALASGAPGTGFAAEPLTRADLDALVAGTLRETGQQFDRLVRHLDGLDPADRALAERVLAARPAFEARIAAARGMRPSGGRCRIHGDYHLGQVLVVETDVAIIDFEGEPARSLAERTVRTSPLRDVAGMLRSFDYALWTAIRRRIEMGADPDRTLAVAEDWRRETQGAFLDAWRAAMRGSVLAPESAGLEGALLDLFLIAKAAHEVGYELASRPDWIAIPLRGLLALIDDAGGAR
jgi:maltose alpha-D-glucosyltransferase / alpha-amylase